MLDRCFKRMTLLLSLATLVGGCPSAFADCCIETSKADSSDIARFKSMVRKPNPKIGLVLGGGGARGPAHVGVMQVLEQEGIKYDYIVGTSVGSVVGGFYAAGVPLDELQKDFESGELMKHYIPVSLPVRLALAPVLYIPRLLGSKPYDGLYRGSKFRKYLMNRLPNCDLQIEHLKTHYSAVAFNVLNGKPYIIRCGDIETAMRASSAVPGLVKPVEIGDKLFADGGVVCNLPVKQCRELGADIVIAINIDEPFNDLPKNDFRRPGSITRRMINWDLYDSDQPQEQLADIVIHPDTEGVTLLTTSKKHARYAYEAGVEAGKAAIPEIRSKLRALNLLTDK